LGFDSGWSSSLTWKVCDIIVKTYLGFDTGWSSSLAWKVCYIIVKCWIINNYTQGSKIKKNKKKSITYKNLKKINWGWKLK